LGYSVQIFFIIENKAVGASLKIPVIAPAPIWKWGWKFWDTPDASTFQTLCKSRGNNG